MNIEQLCAAGYWPIPLQESGKKPHTGVFKSGGVQGYWDAWRNGKLGYEKIKRYWEKFPDANVGISCEGLVVVDLDTQEAVEWGKQLDNEFGSVTGKGEHIIYRENPKYQLTTVIAAKTVGLDIKTGLNNYIVVPESWHESGKQYKWKHITDKGLLPVIRKKDIDKIKKFIRPSKAVKESKTDLDLSSVLEFYEIDSDAHKRVNSCIFEDHTDTKGSFRINGEKWHCSCLPKQTGGAYEFIARKEGWLANGDEFWKSPGARSKTFKKAQEIDPALSTTFAKNQEELVGYMEEVNNKYFFLEDGNTSVVRENEEGLSFISISGFKSSKNNTQINKSTLGTLWMMHPLRRTFEKIVFRPSLKVGKYEYNLFKGWSVKPSSGSCQPIIRHIRDVLCGGRDDLAEWVLDWSADIFQNPESKLKTSIGLTGAQGTGKTMFYSIFNAILGKHAAISGNMSYLTNRFNQHLQDKLLVFMDEAFFGGQIQTANALKNIITGDSINIEIKGGSHYQARNFMRIVVASNEEHFVHLDGDDRRWLILPVSDKYQNDKDYFSKLSGCIDQESGAFLKYLLNREIKNNLAHPPGTEQKDRLKLLSMKPIERWWLDCLVEGSIGYEKSGYQDFAITNDIWNTPGCPAKTEEVFSSFLTYADKMKLNTHERVDKARLGIYLAKATDGNIQKRRLDQSQTYVMPALDTCRELFASYKSVTNWLSLQEMHFEERLAS